jgi:hypothetical protein
MDKLQEIKTRRNLVVSAPWTTHDGTTRCTCLRISGQTYPVASVEFGEWGDSYPAIRQQPGTGSVERKYEAYMEFIPYGAIPEEEAVANARFIANAPEDVDYLVSEIERLKSGNFTEEEFQNLCHCVPEEDKEKFFQGCTEYQRKLFGVAAVDEEKVNV